MAAVTVPIILLGRYSTFTGEGTFTTFPVNVMAYQSMELTVWRGEIPANTSFQLKVETSMDRVTWDVAALNDPGQDQEQTIPIDIEAAWLRGKVTLAKTGSEWPEVTCYAVGALVSRAKHQREH